MENYKKISLGFAIAIVALLLGFVSGFLAYDNYSKTALLTIDGERMLLS